MEDDINLGSGTDDGAGGIPDSAPAGGEQAAPDEAASPRPGEKPDDSGPAKAGGARNRDEGGRFTHPAPRSLEELIADSDNMAKWTNPLETRKIVNAGKFQIATEAEYAKRFGGKGKTAAPAAGAPASAPEGGEQPPAAGPKAAPKPGTPEAHLATIVKAIHPDLDPSKPEDVVRSLQNFQGALTRNSQELTTLKRAQDEIANGLLSRLSKGKDGLKEIFSLLKVDMPSDIAAFVGGSAAAPAASGAPAQPAAASGLSFLDGLRDDDYVPVSTLKTAIPSLIETAVTQALAKVDGRIKPVEETFKTVSEQIAHERQQEQIKATRASALADAQFYSEYWGGFYPDEALKDKAEKIWNESVGRDGKLLSQPHAEWPKLQKILAYRRTEFLDKDDRAASFEHHLYERLHKGGKMFELLKAREERGRQKTLEAQNRRVQPALAGGVRPDGGGLNGLRIPQSESDLDDMTPQQLRELRAKVKHGKIAVRNA